MAKYIPSSLWQVLNHTLNHSIPLLSIFKSVLAGSSESIKCLSSGTHLTVHETVIDQLCFETIFLATVTNFIFFVKQ